MSISSPKLYVTTEELIKRFKPSLTAFFDVYIPNNVAGDNEAVNFMAYEAVLPGTSFETSQVFGDRQGITEQYPTKRVYPQVDVSFYVDNNYDVINFFETWMEKIHPHRFDGHVYSKFEYPNSYESDIFITKFERNFRAQEDRLKEGGEVGKDNEVRITYTLRKAYPTNIISIPVSYGQSDLLRTTITFNYDYYSFRRKINKTDRPGPFEDK